LFLSVLSKVRNVQKDFDFDLIDAHYVYPDGFAAVLLGKFLKKPVVVSARGTDINLYTKLPLIKRLISYTLRKANSVISVCQALKNEMVKIGVEDKKISVIPNGVDPKKFFPTKKEVAREKLSLPLNKKILLSVGALIPRKGFELLIGAISLLKDDFNENELLLAIVGEGDFRRHLEGKIDALGLGSKVKLIGAVRHCQLSLWYNAADLFCLASDREGWPNVLFESLACGTPVVATKVWGIPEILRSEKLGILVERDPDEIAKGILKGLKKDWDYSHIVEYAQENTWHKVAKRVFTEFTKVINR
jgi:glycosyltransferase involved in cell wall biosynthesis